MVFSAPLFLFLFLPLFLAGYYALPSATLPSAALPSAALPARRSPTVLRYRRPVDWRLGWLLAASWLFYGWWRIDFLGLLVAATLWTWLLGRAIARGRAGERAEARSASLPASGLRVRLSPRAALAAGIGLNLGILAYFKYFNFGVDSLNTFLGLFGRDGFTAWRVILPIGISFYVFQAISYLVDVYRGDAPAAGSFPTFATFLALFPQLIAGPILRYKDMAGQLRERPHSFEGFSEGAVRFMTGFCKKVLIADTVAPLAGAAFGLDRPSFADAWIGLLAYTVQIYFDFSGYSDMAIGLGRMIGFRFMENFDRPYLSRSITEFWRRWHISLSTWLRDYLYIPLGGNRRGAGRTYVNLLTVMLFGGLWHGASWTFALWGLWHGLLLAAERLLRSRPPTGRFGRRRDGGAFAGRREARGGAPVPLAAPPTRTPPARPASEARGGPAPQEAPGRAAGWPAVALTMFLVMIGWVMFRAGDLAGAAAMYAGMIGLHGWGLSGAFAWQMSGAGLAALLAALALIYAAPAFQAPGGAAGWRIFSRWRRRAAGRPAGQARNGPPPRQGWAAGLAMAPLFLLGILKLAADSYSPFLYFRF